MKKAKEEAAPVIPPFVFISEDGITPAGTIVKFDLDLAIAKLLYNSSGRDKWGDILRGTVSVQKRGDDYELAATDTHRMYVVKVSQLGSLFPVGQGIYRWLMPPVKGRQVLERISGKFPNYPKAVPNQSDLEVVGFYKCEPPQLWSNHPISVNVDYLPRAKGKWTVYGNPADQSKPYLLTGDLGQYVLMPLYPRSNECAPEGKG